MPFFLYNTITRAKELFIPKKSGEVSMYSCGPTVYNTAHVGNLRAFLFADTLQRWLRFGLALSVKWVMNITDIDDKTIRDSKRDYPEKDPKEALSLFTRHYAQLFFDDLQKIGVNASHFLQNPYATEYIPQMQELIQNIMKRGYAYIADNSVYLDVQKYRKDYEYGRLVSLHFDDMVSTSRVENDEYDKASAADFVLWKGKKEGEPSWNFDIQLTNGETVSIAGRPGWHIECSAMSKTIFPDFPFDIHTGGVDLCFPHHEDEICQAMAGYGLDTANYWAHNEHLMVDGKKMSKSLGNFYLLADIEAKGFAPEELRFFMVTNHYRTKLNLSDESLAMAKNTLDNLRQLVAKVSKVDTSALSVSDSKKEFIDAMNDDLNVSVALAAYITFLKKAAKEGIAPDNFNEFYEFVSLVENVFGVTIKGGYVLLSQVSLLPETAFKKDISVLQEKMTAARAEKDWTTSDRIRDEIIALAKENGVKILF